MQGPKTSTSVPTRKPTSTVNSKLPNATVKSTTQARSTAATTRQQAADEKDKSKPRTTIEKDKPKPKTTAGIPTKAPPQTKLSKNPSSTKTATKIASTSKSNSTTVAPKPHRLTQNVNRDGSKIRTSTQPVRAKHSPAIVEAVKKHTVKQPQVVAAKPNAVLDTFHNVTVASPPPRRKSNAMAPTDETTKKSNSESTNSNTPREDALPRSGTGTLDDEEIVVLRTDSAKKRSEQQILADIAHMQELTIRKEAVAFEVNFEQKQKSAAKSREPSRTRSKTNTIAGPVLVDEEPASYSDDFESYESDFESGSTSRNATPTDSSSESESQSDSDALKSTSSDEESDAKQDHAEPEEEDEESELTQYPITVIQREKERENKLDSGHYDVNGSRKPQKLIDLSAQSSQQQCDSLDTSYSVANSEQLDSGISSYGNGNGNNNSEVANFHNTATLYSGYAQFNTRPVFNKRGRDLMSKIQFDTLTFTLFDLKPISYDVYMRTYGKLNAAQASTQTNENRMSTECQTEAYEMRTMWTQHPPLYDLQTVQKLTRGLNGAPTVQNCCGEQPAEELQSTAPAADEYDASLRQLARFRQSNHTRILEKQLKQAQKPLDFERLNAFLLNASMLMSKVLNASPNGGQLQPQLQMSADLAIISEGYFQLDTRFLNALQVIRIFANAKHNLIITVHESLPDADVYREDFSNLLMVWSTSERSKPIRLLSSWSEVCRAEISNESADIIVCGLRDGSIAMWDLRETYSYCSKLDGYLTHFAATQSIVPTWQANEQGTRLLDLGAVVDIKSFRPAPKTLALVGALASHKNLQFTSLNDTGILTVWTLVDTNTKHSELSTPNSTQHQRRPRHSPATHNSRFEYSSPWARVKLIQSAICDLRDYLERGLLKTQTPFERTRSLFQQNIYDDELLRVLHTQNAESQQHQQSLQGLRFTGIDTGCERIYVCTNRSYILACSKSLKTERFRRIPLQSSGFLFPTALRVLTNEDFLAVGLSNGSVMIVNCSQHKTRPRVRSPKVPPTPSSVSGTATAQEYEPETGKSCAIQNIILNERRGYDNEPVYAQETYEVRPNTAACIALITTQQRPFELRVYDQQLLLSGTALRKHLVQSLELSSDGWRLFALSNGEVRTYDFYLDNEVAQEESGGGHQRIVDMAAAKTTQNEQHLLVLTKENEVQVHVLKQ